MKPDGKWAFDGAVTDCFTDMLARSIPDYATMRRLVFDLGSWFVQPKTDVIDIGCSRGDGLAPFIDRFGAGNRYFALDESGPMVTACRERFAGWVNNGLLDVRQHDLRDGLPPLMPSLILSVLTLQFVPIECRQRIIADAYHILRPGGALDWIVMKALEKDRDRRYETVTALARDVERYLRDEPVQACPPSVGYRFRKFARRNKVVLLGAVTIAAVLIVATGVSTHQAARAPGGGARSAALRSGTGT